MLTTKKNKAQHSASQKITVLQTLINVLPGRDHGPAGQNIYFASRCGGGNRFDARGPRLLQMV
jgi:hypothetical protein